ncbi:MAG: hypothetical protein PF495_00625, partial [Spirochaetales bacterium]|nr:hypothetical protein [Spirochaetales bacterium]
LRDARQQAEDITEEAKKEAEEIVKNAQKDAAQTEQSSRAALQQASRDTMLSLEKKIVAVCDAALLGETKKILKPDFLAKLAEDVIKSETLPPQQIQAEFSKKDAAQVHELLKKSLDSELKKGLELTVSKAVSGGFIFRQ